MNAFIVESYGRTERTLIEKTIKKHHIKKFYIYSLDSKDKKKGVNFLNVKMDFSSVQDMAFELLERKKVEVQRTSEYISKIFRLDLIMFTHRLLLNKLFYREAQFLLGKQILSENGKFSHIYIIAKFDEILNDCTNVIYYPKSYIIKIYLKSILKYFAKITLLLISKLILFFNQTKEKKINYDIIAQIGPIAIRHIIKTLFLLKDKYKIAITPDISNLKKKRYIKPIFGIDTISIFPSIKIKNYFEVKKIFSISKINNFKKIFIYNFDNISIRKLISKYVAKKFNPKLILFKNEYDLFENVEYAVFKNFGIKCIDYMHGEKIYDIQDSFIEYDTLTVWGKYYKYLFEKKLKVKKDMIEITGNPIADEIPSYSIKNNMLINKLKRYKKVISIFTQPSSKLNEDENQSFILKKILNYMKHTDGVLLAIKYHPREYNLKTLPYRNLFTSLENKVFECRRDTEVYDILSLSDLAITSHSTVGLEAILFKKPVLFINFGNISGFLEYPKINAAVELTQHEDCRYYLDKMLYDKDFIKSLNFEKVIKDWANGLDGGAHVRLAEIIEKAMKQR